MISRRLFIAGLAATLALPALLTPGTARAQNQDALLAAGTAGERWDGYMEARDPSAAGAVAAINDKRRAVYQRRAAEQGVPVEEVAKVYAQEIIGKISAGSWVKRQSGEWVQK